MSNIAIIPARGGSKRIPRKNIKYFLGKPIIAYSIQTALESKLFDEVMVSTDDEEIAEIAKSYGASVPFMRSANNANDHASTVDVLKEVLSKYSNKNISFRYSCCIYATAPFVTKEKLISAFDILLNNKYDTVAPVMPYSFPVQRGLKMKEGKVRFAYPEYMNSRSQDLDTLYHDAGQFYFFDTQSILEKGTLWTNNTGGVIISELEAQDIDSELDWRLAELKYRLLR